jgi:acylphosphatase
MAIKRLAITISGRVQGVGFRYFTRDAAESYELSGWVRNNPDRTVECEVQGKEEDLESFCQQVSEGPPLSKIMDFEVREIPIVKDEPQVFEIGY